VVTPVVLLALLSQGAPPGDTGSTLERIEREVVAIVEKLRPSVVQVTAVFSVEPGKPIESLAFSGIVYTPDGFIVTAASGVDLAREIRVGVGERTFPGRHVASDRRTGVAVLKVEAKGLSPARLAETPPRPGATAIVVGNPLGLRGAAAFGNVSGLDRTVQVGGRSYDDLIQMSVPVQPGDCGGLVADSRGDLIGLIHSVFAPQAAPDRSSDLLRLFRKDPGGLLPVPRESVSFATPAAWVKFSADRIIRHGRMVRGWVGITARELEAEARTALGLKEGEGVEIIRVEKDGPAQAANLAARDILVEFDGQPIRGLDGLRRKVAQTEEPRTVQVAYLRGGERRFADLEIRIDSER
jgi:S1-C subfamily serine protease